MSIEIKKLTHVYMQDSPFESTAIKDIDLSIKSGDFIGLIGHTGSGKSTLIQHLNGLLKPTSGTILINGADIFSDKKVLKGIRQMVGLVFQYPEHQLFEETVYKDIAFGPLNMGLTEEETELRVRYAMNIVNLDWVLTERSPFDLSGGQRRRVAIAGVIAMKPDVLILDEPTAGLDPRGKDEILDQIKKLHVNEGKTIIFVSHSMEDIARLADKIIVMNQGRVEFTGTPSEIFNNHKRLSDIGLGVPQITKLLHALADAGAPVKKDVYLVDQAKHSILSWLRGDCDA